MAITTYIVRGMTCGHCVAAVTEELKSIQGVTNVTVDLVEGGDSTVSVTSTDPLDIERVKVAVDEAGYAVIP